MSNRRYLFLLVILIVAGCASSTEPYVLPQEDAVHVEEIARLPSFTEGIVFDGDGNAYISELERGVISKMTPSGDVESWVTLESPNGHKILSDGTHLVCDAVLKAVVHISATGEVLGNKVDQFNGQPLNGPNDITLDKDGKGFYFTDPQGSWANNPIGAVYHMSANGVLSSLVDTLAYPNGVVLDAERNRLIVSETALNRILVFPLIEPAKVGPGEVFIDLPKSDIENHFFAPDGMLLDEAGNLFVAHFGMESVKVIDPDGQQIRSYKTDIIGPTNVLIRKSNGSKTLYVTGAVSFPHRESEGALLKLEL